MKKYIVTVKSFLGENKLVFIGDKDYEQGVERVTFCGAKVVNVEMVEA